MDVLLPIKGMEVPNQEGDVKESLSSVERDLLLFAAALFVKAEFAS